MIRESLVMTKRQQLPSAIVMQTLPGTQNIAKTPNLLYKQTLQSKRLCIVTVTVVELN